MTGIGLMAILLLGACTPGMKPESEATPIHSQTAALPATTTPAPPATLTVPVPTQASTSAPAPLPVATSRGPNLEASDPTTVSLASGGVQFVEFFRFT